MYCVFIPGIMGSTLFEGTNKRFPVFLRKSVANLALNDKSKQMRSDVQENFLGYPTYGPIDSFLKERFGPDFYHFSYDWRFDIKVHFETLFAQLKDKSEIVLVAHSMGGLIAKLFIHWCYDNNLEIDIKKVISCGTPWQGSLESVYQLTFGDGYPRWFFKYMPLALLTANSDVIKKITGTFPSVYQLLPHDDYINHVESVITGSNGQSFSASQTYTKLFDHQQFNNYVTYSKPIQNQINAPWPNESIEHIAIIGHEKSTLGQIHLEQNTTSGVIRKKEVSWTSGDGTVPLKSAIPVFASEKIYIRRDHLDLIKSKEVMDLIYAIIRNDDHSYSLHNDFTVTPSHDIRGVSLRIACPVSVALFNNGKYIAGEIETEDMSTLLSPNWDDNFNVLRINDSFHIFVDEVDNKENQGNLLDVNQSLDVDIVAFDEGLVTCEVSQFTNGEINESKVFSGLVVTSESRARLMVTDKNVKESKLILTTADDEVEQIRGYALNKQELGQITNPKTNWYIVNDPVGQIENYVVYDSAKIIVEIDESSTPNDLLEYRYILNGQLYKSDTRKFILENLSNINTLTVFSVTKNGLCDIKPKTVKFYKGEAKVTTHKKTVLYSDYFDVIFNEFNTQDTGVLDEQYKVTFVKLPGEDKYTPLPQFKMEYSENPVRITYYTEDKFKKRSQEDECLLPSKRIRDKIFKSDTLTAREVLHSLGIEDPQGWNIKINKRTANLESKITPKTKRAEFIKDDTEHLIIFQDDFELFWESGLAEVIKSHFKEQLISFELRRASNGNVVRIDELNALSIKVYTEEGIDLDVEIPIDFDGEVFRSKLNLNALPPHIRKGYLKVFVNERIVRELRFIFE